MKVIHINDKLTVSGGVEVSIRDIVTESCGRGIETHWVAIRRVGKEIEILAHDLALSWRGPISELASSSLFKIIDRDTIFHVHSLSEPAIMRELFEYAPVVRHIHDQRFFCPGQGKFWAATETICSRPFGLHCLGHAYTKRCCNRHPKRLLQQFNNTRFEVSEASARYAMMIANSSYSKSEALKVGFPEEKILVINYFTVASPEPNWEAASPPVITFAGRLSRTKGLHLLLDAFAQVCCEIPEARLNILGSGHDEQLFRKQAKDLGLDDVVRFLGWVDKAEIDAHLSGTAVVAFPSIYPEAFGITGIEAMMRGKPVVAFDVGGVSDWLRHGETGYAIPAKDTDAFARALETILREPELKKTMGLRARQYAEEAFSPEPYFSALLEIYERALQ